MYLFIYSFACLLVIFFGVATATEITHLTFQKQYQYDVCMM